MKMDFDSFVQYSINFLKENSTDISSVELMDSTKLFVNYNEENQSLNHEIGLSNAWRRYFSSGDIEELNHFLSFSLSVSEMKETAIVLSEKTKNIFPVVRPNGYRKKIESSISKDLIGELCLMFQVKEEVHSVYIVSEMKIDDEEIKLETIEPIAMDNLKTMGWMEHVDTEVMKGGTVYVYNYRGLKYNYQFFIKDWVEEKLGKEFYLGLPTNNVAMVFVPNAKAKSKDFIRDRNLFYEEIIVQMHLQDLPLSENIYIYRNGEYTEYVLPENIKERAAVYALLAKAKSSI